MEVARKDRPAGSGYTILVLGLFILLLIPTGHRLYRNLAPFLNMSQYSNYLYDLQLHLRLVRSYDTTGRLYDENPFNNTPAAHVYKYPSPLAALLRCFPEGSWMQVGLRLMLFSGVVLLLTPILLITVLRPPWIRALLMVLVFLNWQSFWESLAGIQLEPAMLLCLTVATLALRSRRSFLSGFAVGVAGALKVYPAAPGLFFLAYHRWRAIAGMVAGAAAMLAITFLAFPPSILWIYLTRVLPHLGGTSLAWENIGLPGTFARLAVFLRSGPAAVHELTQPPYRVVESCEIPGVRAITLLLTLVAAAGLLWVTVRVLQGKRPVPTRSSGREIAARGILGEAASRAGSSVARAEFFGFLASISLWLLLMPTTWSDYQTLLALPVLVCIAQAPAPREDPLAWCLLAAAVVSGFFNLNGAAFVAHGWLMAAVRGWMPLVLWGLCLRLAVRAFQPAGVPRES